MLVCSSFVNIYPFLYVSLSVCFAVCMCFPCFMPVDVFFHANVLMASSPHSRGSVPESLCGPTMDASVVLISDSDGDVVEMYGLELHVSRGLV